MLEISEKEAVEDPGADKTESHFEMKKLEIKIKDITKDQEEQPKPRACCQQGCRGLGPLKDERMNKYQYDDFLYEFEEMVIGVPRIGDLLKDGNLLDLRIGNNIEQHRAVDIKQIKADNQLIKDKRINENSQSRSPAQVGRVSQRRSRQSRLSRDQLARPGFLWCRWSSRQSRARWTPPGRSCL